VPLPLAASNRRAFDRLAADLQRIFGPRFGALVAYTPHASAAFVDRVDADDLDALGALVESWHREGLATPLVMSVDEFRRSLDAFPLEYQAILDRHEVIAGQSPFDGIHVDPADLRRACEAHARGHLIHLRQGWMQAAGHREEVAELIEQSSAPLRALLTNVARLRNTRAATDDELAAFAEQAIGMPADLVRAVLALQTQPETRMRLTARMGEYLTACERLWAFVDTWRH
jgi:hypothetical protein